MKQWLNRGRRLISRSKALGYALIPDAYYIGRPIPPREHGEHLIHLGCGSIDAAGFLNIDGKRAPHVHIVTDLRHLSMLPSGCARLVYACHVLEHFPYPEHKALLSEWARLLRRGGTLRLSVPDFDKLYQIYEFTNRDLVDARIHGPLLGYSDGYSAHAALFNERYLRGLLAEVGLGHAREWTPEGDPFHGFEDWASRCVERNGTKFSISLNLEADAAP